MSRHSSDSDSSSRHKRSRRRRSPSSSSSSSGYHRRSKKSSRHRSSSYRKSKNYNSRSRRRSRSRSNSRNSRSLSRDRRRRRSHSRDRYRSKHHHKSRSHSKSRSYRYQSRSSSKSRHSRSPDRSNSSSSNSSKRGTITNPTQSGNPNCEDQLREKLLRAIKAAESADHQLKQQGVLPKGVKSRNDLSSLTVVKPQGDVIKAIEKDEFVPQTFTSSKSKKLTIKDMTDGPEDGNNVPEAAVNSIFHGSFFCDPKVKLDRWVKKLYQIRQRAISGEPITS